MRRAFEIPTGGAAAGCAAVAGLVFLSLALGAAPPPGERVLRIAESCRLTDVAAGGPVAVVAVTQPARGIGGCPVTALVRQGAAWSAAQTVAPAGSTGVAAAVGPRGDAALAWLDDAGRLRVAVRPAGAARFGAPETPPGSLVVERDPRLREPPGLGVDGAGGVYAATEDLVVHVRATGGGWRQDAGARDAAELPAPGATDTTRVTLAVNAAGDLALGTARVRYGSRFTPEEIYSARVLSRRAGGAWSAGLRFIEPAERPEVGIDGAGTVTAAWAQNEPSAGVFRAEGPAGGEIAGRTKVLELSATIVAAPHKVALAVAEGGGAALATVYGGGGLRAAYRPPGGPWGGATPVVPRGDDLRESDEVDAAIDGRGAAALVSVFAGPARATVASFTHAAGAGPWSPPWRLSTRDGVEALVGVDGAGLVAPVWRSEGGPLRTVSRPLAARDVTGTARPTLRLLALTPRYRGGTPARCVAPILRRLRTNPGSGASLARCAPRLALRIRYAGPRERLTTDLVGGGESLSHFIALRPGTATYEIRLFGIGEGLRVSRLVGPVVRFRVTLSVPGAPAVVRTVRVVGCPGRLC